MTDQNHNWHIQNWQGQNWQDSDRQRQPLTLNNQNPDWRELARRASEEMDPDRLLELVRQLNHALDQAIASPFAPVTGSANTAD